MPVLLSNVQDRVKQKRVENIKQKLSKVTDKMAVQSGLTGYGDTMSFVQEMSKHMKLAKICDNDHLSDCWPTQEVLLKKAGKTWSIADTKNAKNLRVPTKISSSWADTVGIVTADGTPMILSYKKDCDFDVDKGGLIFDKASAMSNSMECLSGVFDWNGGKKPNKLGDDVVTIGMASGLGTECAFELGDKCFTAPFKPTPLSDAECEKQKTKLNIKECCRGWCGGGDYWVGAVAKCGGTQNMPTKAQLAQLASMLYQGNPTIGAEQNIDEGLNLNTSVTTSLGFPDSDFFIWAADEHRVNNAGHYRYFGPVGTSWGSNGRRYSFPLAVCVGD